MATQTTYPRPKGPVENWSETQAERWIKAQAKSGNIEFRYHAEHDRGKQYNVSPDEALEAVLKGRRFRWEPRFDPKSQTPTMNMSFRQTLKSHSIGVVTSIANGDPTVVVVTLWKDEPL